MSMMKICHIAFVVVALSLAASSALARMAFSRYEVILDRMPFGEVKAPVVAAKPVEPAQPPPEKSFVRNLKLCALKQVGSGVKVGFFDKKTKPQKNYFLYVGQTSDDGIEVVDADFEEEKALLRQNGQEYWLHMTGWATAGGGGMPTQVSSGSAPSVGSRTSKPGARHASTATSADSTSKAASRGSYLERLRQRRAALAKRNEAIVKSRMNQPSATARRKKLEEYNMQLIREGKPALPVQLTKEQDDQLVKEGVLPAAPAK